MQMTDTGVLRVNDVEVRYMPTQDLFLRKPLHYVDVWGLMPFLDQLSFDPITQEVDPLNVALVGPKGIGKSLLPAYWAQVNEIPYLAVDCSSETRERTFKGGFIARSGETPWVLGTVANAILAANMHGSALLVIEELTALPNQIQKLLNPLTDFRKKIEIPELSWTLRLEEGKKLYVMATMNPVGQGGHYEVNDDLKSRLTEIEMTYPMPAQEKQVLRAMGPRMEISDALLDQLVNIARESRQYQTTYALSTRDLVQFLVVATRAGTEAMLSLMYKKFPIEDRELMAERIRDITGHDPSVFALPRL